MFTLTYKQIKWLILTIPTLVIGLWEYIRHEFLLPYISMDLGNWLSPVIVFLVTITLLRRLFVIYEQMQEQLKREREDKAILQERERIARELHDGIAQSLFLFSVQFQTLKAKHTDPEWEEMDQSLRKIYDYVRHSIANLKKPPTLSSVAWNKKIEDWVMQYQIDTGTSIQLDVNLDQANLTSKEKLELFSCIQEALNNIRKHAEAQQIWITFSVENKGWKLEIIDDGKGFTGDPFQKQNRFGLKIMRERVQEIQAHLSLRRKGEQTYLLIKKEGNS
nr:histidine kinase [Hazenella coriacea]